MSQAISLSTKSLTLNRMLNFLLLLSLLSMCIKIESISVHGISITKNAKNLIADTERDIRDLPHQLASVMPGDVVISTIFFQTIINAASLYLFIEKPIRRSAKMTITTIFS